MDTVSFTCGTLALAFIWVTIATALPPYTVWSRQVAGYHLVLCLGRGDVGVAVVSTTPNTGRRASVQLLRDPMQRTPPGRIASAMRAHVGGLGIHGGAIDAKRSMVAIAMPLWMPVLILVSITSVWVLFRSEPEQTGHQCPTCGYDMSWSLGYVPATCPECGTISCRDIPRRRVVRAATVPRPPTLHPRASGASRLT